MTVVETGQVVWTPHLGDPGYAPWLIVGIYGLAAVQSWRASRVATAHDAKFWIVLAILCAALCLNKQLDLQTLLTQIGRSAARSEGWYAQRRTFQLAFIAAFAGVTLIGAAAMLVRFRNSAFSLWLSAGGLSLQGLFVVMRAASMHHADALFRHSVGGFRLLFLLELPGVILVVIGASLYMRNMSRKRTRSAA